ncbi:MAG: AAA family ATPase [Anaerolineae bacterium]|nr:AAA family ATPase [Anaerolineae bacterium]
MTVSPRELSAEALRRACVVEEMGFASTAELPELTEIIGQERATRAIEFGIDIPCYGYNIYAMGPPGAGKTTTIMTFLQRKARTQPVPSDWAYVNNFENPDHPNAIRMPPGTASKFSRAVDEMLETLQTELPRAFESSNYDEHRRRLTQEIQAQQAAKLQELEEWVSQRGFALLRGPAGLIVAPVQDGEVVSPEQYAQLPPERRAQWEKMRPEVQERLEQTMRQVRELEKEARNRLRNLDQEIAAFTLRHHMEALLAEFGEMEEVAAFLQAVEKDLVRNVHLFKRPAPGAGEGEPEGPLPSRLLGQGSPYDRYRVNVLVDNGRLEGAPVVLETNPTYQNLVGRIEHRAQFGTLVTDFSMIRPGALHRANGGYLVLDARAVLSNPLAWDALKRALRNQEIRIEEVSQQMALISTVSLTPEPIPLDVKVVLIGDPTTYYLLYSLDPQFEKLFKVRADFSTEMDWTRENVEKVARFIRARCEEENLLHFDLGAVARVVEYSARLVENQRKLSTRFARVADIVREASYWAKRNGRDLVTAADVDQAVGEWVYRSNRLEEMLRERIAEGTILVDTHGEVVGQVNGLSVIQLGDYEFGRPNRITARTYLGSKGLVNIEREVKMSGRIHDKGVLILVGYLGGKYAQQVPLQFSASICFEQAYEGVEGDSASSTELYALLSSLSGLPIKQGIAVTGSVNQRGQIQPIGGVNQKIEGFYEVCKIQGLDGTQGVIIPKQNVHNLMLREEVVQAVAEGKFHIWPVETVDQGIEILTGVPAGELQEDGTYPEGTVNFLVVQGLRRLAETLQKFGKEEAERKEPEENAQKERPQEA